MNQKLPHAKHNIHLFVISKFNLMVQLIPFAKFKKRQVSTFLKKGKCIVCHGSIHGIARHTITCYDELARHIT